MNQTIRKSVLLLDLFWIFAAFSLPYLLRYKNPGLAVESWASFREFLPAVLAALGLWTILYLSKSLDGFRGGWHLPTVFSEVLVGVVYLMAFLLAIAFLQRHYYSRLLLLYLAILLPAGLIAVRCIIRAIVSSKASRWISRRAVILGTGNVARELAYKISRHPEMLLEIVGSLYPAGGDSSNGLANPSQEACSVQSLNVSTFLREKNVRELIVVMPHPPGAEVEKVISKCREVGMIVRLVPQWYELYVSEAQMIEVDGVPLISLEERNISAVAVALKRIVDFVAGSFLLILTTPALFLFAIAIRRERRSAFSRETRCGEMGILFQMFRLNVDRDVALLAPFDKFLTSLSLTELPQLWNVVRGDMSLVGPRPEAPERVRHYSDWQRQRLSVKPGLTGLAQVHGLREQHSSEEKAKFDLEYIYHWSVFLDFALILQTAWTLAVRLVKHRPNTQPKAGVRQPFDMPVPEGLRADRSQSSAD